MYARQFSFSRISQVYDKAMKSSTHLELLVCVYLLHQAACTGLNVSCLDTTVPLGGKTQVVCHFNKDVSVSHTDFVVLRFPIGTTTFNSRIAKQVLVYNWDQRKKHLEPGYGFDNDTIGSNVVLTIDKATKEQEGIYRCELIDDQTPINTCTLRVIEDGNQATPQAVSDFISSVTPTGAFILIIVGLLGLLFICFFVTYHCHKYTCRRQVDCAVQTTVDLAERGTNTIDRYSRDLLDFGTNTEDFSNQQPAVKSSKGKSSGYSRKEEKLRPEQNRQSVERGINTSTPNCVSVGTDIEDIPDQHPVSFKRRCSGLFSRKKDKRSLLPLVRSHSVDNIEDTHNEGNSSLSRQHANSPSMQTCTANIDDKEDKQHQPLMQSENQTPTLADSPTNTDPDWTILASIDLQSRTSFDEDSYEDRVGSGGADSARMGAMDNASISHNEGPSQNDPATTYNENGKGPEKEKKGRMRKALSLLTKL